MTEESISMVHTCMASSHIYDISENIMLVSCPDSPSGGCGQKEGLGTRLISCRVLKLSDCNALTYIFLKILN